MEGLNLSNPQLTRWFAAKGEGRERAMEREKRGKRGKAKGRRGLERKRGGKCKGKICLRHIRGIDAPANRVINEWNSLTACHRVKKSLTATHCVF